MADIPELVNQATPLLLAWLMQLGGRVGEGAAGTAGERIADESMQLAKRLWERIRRHLREPERVERAVDKASATPSDASGSTAADRELRRQLDEALHGNPELVSVVAAMLKPESAMPAEQNIGIVQYGRVDGGTQIGIGKIERR